MPDIQEILTTLHNPSEKETALIEKAYHFSQEAHEGQKRFSGDPYFVHAFETGKNLAIFGMDTQTITAGLLHDVLEDAGISEEIIEKEFGKNILFLIKGVTKLGKLKYRGLERHVESLRKLFIATAEDPRVILIKLADRLHNVKTLAGHKDPQKQRRIALETIEIFAPLANRLGMGKLRGELEDYSFPYAYPTEYQTVRSLLKERGRITEKYVGHVHKLLQKELVRQGFSHFKLDHRLKYSYSLYRKLLRNDMDIEKIYDLVALRVIVPTVADCYRVLGVVHTLWRPLPGRVKDYIATPKPNGYQSLHTTIFTGDGGIAEIQIRTEAMHQEAEYGIASHLAYKEGIFELIKRKRLKTKKLSWIDDMIELQKHLSKNGEYLENLKMDFFRDRVFVFTPKGDVIDLPEDSTPVDFAYAIHSAIGDHVAGAKVDGKLVSLDTKLKNGNIVEIVTRKGAHPSVKWSEHAKTTLAHRHIRSAVQKRTR
ncbi:MAG: RelA/SpoT family protein [Minisyncoccota bacterium]